MKDVLSEKHLKLFDFILPLLSERYDDSLSLSDLTHKHKNKTGVEFSHNEERYFIDSYNYEYIEYIDRTIDHIKITPEAKDIIDTFGSLTKFFDEQKKLIQKEKSSSDEITKLKTENLELQNKNLILQNKRLKRHVLYSIISFIAGAILTNIKDILILLNILNQE